MEGWKPGATTTAKPFHLQFLLRVAPRAHSALRAADSRLVFGGPADLRSWTAQTAANRGARTQTHPEPAGAALAVVSRDEIRQRGAWAATDSRTVDNFVVRRAGTEPDRANRPLPHGVGGLPVHPEAQTDCRCWPRDTCVTLGRPALVSLPPMTRAPTGVVMLNLGGPKSLDEVGPFLEELFADREIIQLPMQDWLGPFIAKRRTPAVQRNYADIGGGSPILDWTSLQVARCARLDELSPKRAA